MINQTQTTVLKAIDKAGKAEVAKFNGNTINALAKRKLISVTGSKTKFAKVTKAGKKILN